MQLKPLKRMGGAIAIAFVALMLIGCRGATGQNGANGTNGTNGSNGGNGNPGATFALDASTFTPDQWSELTLKGTVTSVTMGTTPVVNFKVVDANNTPLKGLGFAGQGTADPFKVYLNMGFSIAKLIPADATTGAPSRWVSYIVTSNPTVAAPTTWVPTRPSTDSIGTLVDNLDGTYKYTFRRDISQTKAQIDAYTYTGNNLKADLDDVSYAPNLTHRLTAYVGGTAWGTGSNNATRTATGVPSKAIKYPANFFYDFVPSTGAPVTAANEQREITSVDKCFSCHSKFEFHGEGRQDSRYCVVCHNDQRKFGRAEATISGTVVTNDSGKFRGRAMGDFPSFIHRIHRGEELSLTGYAYGGVAYNDVTYPQDQRNCVKCHTNSTATPQGENWWKKPNRMACGGCHDNLDFQTGDGHGAGGPQLNDQNCVNCHTEAYIKLDHIPIVPPNPQNIYLVPGTGNNNTNASFIGAFSGATAKGTPLNLPAGAKIPTWDLKSFTFNTTGQPVFVFRFLQDGVAVPFTNPATKTEFWDGFVGGPSFYVQFTVPYDGITYPGDWNASFSTYFKNIWRGDSKDMAGAALAASAKATLTGPDTTGYYTLTFTNAIIPTNAGMITGGIGYTYGLTTTQPLTQITGVVGYPWAPDFYAYNVEGKKQGGLSVPAPNVWKMVSGTLPAGIDVTQATTPRRVIVSNQKCNDCHGALGVFTGATYHSGQRNDAPTCEFCHNGQRVNSGWGVNTKDFVHALHGAGKRVNKFSWEASAGNKYWEITYPSVLNNCEICHVPGSYDFGNTTNAGEVPNLNWTTVATGVTPSPMNVVITGTEPIPGTYWSQFSKDAATASNNGNPTGYNFGSAFSYNANTGAITNAAVTTLVSSPYVAACSNCHDSVLAINHFKAMGGSFYATRGSVQANPAAPVAGAPLVNKEQCFVCHSAGKIADVRVVHMNFK
jgi:OmcA/MtrC family decaheme c-type cytochrome